MKTYYVILSTGILALLAVRVSQLIILDKQIKELREQYQSLENQYANIVILSEKVEWLMRNTAKRVTENED